MPTPQQQAEPASASEQRDVSPRLVRALGEYERFEGSAQQITPAAMMAEFHLLGHGESGDDPESQEFFSEVDRLNSGWKPGDVPRVPDEYQSSVERSPASLEEESRALLLRDSLAELSAYWDAQGHLTAEQKRRQLEEEKWRRQLAAKAESAAEAMPAGRLIEQVRSGESERLRAEGRRNYLMNRAKLARWRREGYTFDAQHRLVAPRTPAASHRGEREQRPSATRRSSTRSRSGSRGDPPQDADPPPVQPQPAADVAASRRRVPTRRVSWWDVSTRLNVALEWHQDGADEDAWAVILGLLDEIDRDLRDERRSVAA